MIKEKNFEETIAEIYEDQWTDSCRVQFLDEGNEKEYSPSALERLLERKGWSIIIESLANSGSKRYIVNQWTERKCSECSSSPLYDTSKGEWYCPQCDL